VPDVVGPTHAYISAVPGCWQLYGDVLATLYPDPRLVRTHTLAVDAYAVQHPHHDDRRNRQSVGVHLISLCALLERDLPAARSRTLIGEIASARRARGGEWPLLVPADLGPVSIADVHAADGAARPAAIQQWADSVWQAFAEHQPTVRGWLDAAWPETAARRAAHDH
jgi:hypothetical protein